jgi:hypothetical protein
VEQEKKTYITDAGFRAGARVKLKVTKPPCCGVEPKVDGVILGRAKDDTKWTVQIEGDDEPKDIRFEDLFLVD